MLSEQDRDIARSVGETLAELSPHDRRTYAQALAATREDPELSQRQRGWGYLVASAIDAMERTTEPMHPTLYLTLALERLDAKQSNGERGPFGGPETWN